MKKTQLLISTLLLTTGLAFGQQKYDDFEGNKFQIFGASNGKLDSACANPGAKGINTSAKCVKYTRAKEVKYDNIKIYPKAKLVDVSPFATYVGTPPKIKVKIYSTAPVGTKVELQLGKKGDNNYPSGVHSQYEAITTVQNAWEELTFTFSQIPKGSLVASTEVDQITLLFSPNSTSGDTFYFDDLIGPALASESPASKSIGK